MRFLGGSSCIPSKVLWSVIMANDIQVQHPEYPVFKGLQKPLEFMGLRGRYIYWAAGAIGSGILLFFIGYIVAGFLVGLILITIIIGFGGVMIFVKQHKGLHSKKAPTGIFITCHLQEHPRRLTSLEK